VLVEAELGCLAAKLGLVRARAGDEKPRSRHRIDQPRHRLERELETLLVDEPPDQQHELLVRSRELAAQAAQAALVVGAQVVRVDPVRDHADALLLGAEDVGDLLAHVVGARDHPVGPVRDPALDAVDVALRVLVDPALVAAVLGGVDRHHQRTGEAPCEVVAGHRHEPVVPVDEVELIAIAELDAGGEHVRVHPLDPGDELAQVGGALRLEDAMDLNPRDRVIARRPLAAPRQHVDLDPAVDQALRELAHVPSQPTLDQRRVLPGEDEDSRHGGLSCLLEQRRQPQVRRQVSQPRIRPAGGVYGLEHAMAVP
jgi:hypothetical protein